MMDGHLEPAITPVIANVRDVAQTNLQLYAQLGTRGYGETDIARVRASYALGVTLFANAFRGSEKPFVAHLVGTASAAALQGASLEIVITGLLHAAHTLGQWPRSMGRTNAQQDRAIEQVAGDKVARLVRTYTDFPWSTSAIARYATEPVDETRRTMLLLRLANEVDDWIGHAAVAADAKSKLKLEGRRENLLRIADRYDFPVLRSLLSQVTAPSEEAWTKGMATGRANTFRQDDAPVDAVRRAVKTLLRGTKRKRAS